MKSSYPLGSCPNLGLKINTRHYDSFRRILKTNIKQLLNEVEQDEELSRQRFVL